MSPRVTASDSVFVVVDVQTSHMGKLKTATVDELVHVIETLCSAARLHRIPVLVTGAQFGDVRPPFAGTLGTNPILWRSTANALDDEGFTSAISITRRRTVLFAGVATDIGVALAALSAQQQGYASTVVLDACATNSERAEQAAIARLSSSPVTITSAGAVLAEWQADFSAEHGAQTLSLISSLTTD